MKKLIEAARRVLEEIDLYGMPIPLETVAQLRRAYEEAAEHSVQRTVEACPVSHQSFLDDDENTYLFCPYCGERLHSR